MNHRKGFVFLLLFGFLIARICAADFYPFRVEVKGKGKPVLLIHGLACSGKVWEQTAQKLQGKYELHILHLPGFAGQPAMDLKNGYLPVVKNHIIRYIQNELNEKPVIIGHSLGGFLAMSIAAAEPHRVDKIVVVDSYPFYTAALNPQATVETARPQAENMKKMILLSPDSVFEKQQQAALSTMISDPNRVKLAVRWSLKSDRQTIAQAMYEIMTIDLRDQIEIIQCPVLVLGSWYGAKDFGVTKAMVEANYRNQLKKVSDCTIKIADKARHFIMWDEPEWFMKQVLEFLGDER